MKQFHRLVYNKTGIEQLATDYIIEGENPSPEIIPEKLTIEYSIGSNKDIFFIDLGFSRNELIHSKELDCLACLTKKGKAFVMVYLFWEYKQLKITFGISDKKPTAAEMSLFCGFENAKRRSLN